MSDIKAETVVDVTTASGDESAGEMTWPAPEFDKVPKVPPNPHLLRKKRYHSASFSHSGANGLTIDGIPSDVHTLTAALHHTQVGGTRLPYSKNSRKSRDGRRLPSKRGGKNHDPVDDLDEVELDPNDPDYDSDVNDPVMLEELTPTLSDDVFEQTFISLLEEFFDHGKTQEVIDSLAEINLASHQRRRIPYLAVTLAIQNKQMQCELTSELLSDMCGKILNHAHIQQGFQLVLNEIGELIIDTPKAPEYIGRFIARAVTDDILPPKFVEFEKHALSQLPLSGSPPKVRADGDSNNSELQKTTSMPAPPIPKACEFNGTTTQPSIRPGSRNLSDSSAGNSVEANGTTTSSGIGSASSLAMPPSVRPDLALQALSRAETILTLRHAFARLDNIWGVPAGPKATKILVKKIHRLLNQYMNTGDIKEATEALLELDSPHFCHELVYQAVIMAIELSTDDARDLVIRLLNDLCRSVVITPNQLSLGIRRVYGELPDLQIDVPAAFPLMERFLNVAKRTGFMPASLVNAMPSKHRKRFVSETDSFYRTAHPL